MLTISPHRSVQWQEEYRYKIWINFVFLYSFSIIIKVNDFQYDYRKNICIHAILDSIYRQRNQFSDYAKGKLISTRQEWSVRIYGHRATRCNYHVLKRWVFWALGRCCLIEEYPVTSREIYWRHFFVVLLLVCKYFPALSLFKNLA